MTLERKYNVNIQAFFLTLTLISVYPDGGKVWIESAFKAIRILLLPITAILDLVAITVVFTAKILYSAVIMILEFVKHIIIKLAEMIIKSVLGRIFSILAIVATIYSIYIILTTGSWQEALTQLSVLALEFWNFFYI
jgi:hypothetical protein